MKPANHSATAGSSTSSPATSIPPTSIPPASIPPSANPPTSIPPTTNVLTWSARQVLAGYRDGSLSPVDIVEATLAQADRIADDINPFLCRFDDAARAEAHAAAERWRAGEPRGPLDGLPVTVKDSIAMVGTPWRHGSACYASLPDSQHESPPATRLREAGAVIVGKTTMPDLGMLGTGMSSLTGITRNPWNTSRSPGGSSSGAAASLASGVGYLAVGTDIAGSVRLPGAHCGVSALKPTQGLVPHLPSSTMRSAGPMARSAGDTALLLDVIGRPDERDLYSLPAQSAGPARPVAGARVGVLAYLGYGPEPVPAVLAALDQAAAALVDAGAQIRQLDAPFDVDVYSILDRLFQARAYREWLSTPEAGRAELLPAVRAWCEQARGLPAEQYIADRAEAKAAGARMVLEMMDLDFVLTPVMPCLPFAADVAGPFDPPLAHSVYTSLFNQSGQPAASACVSVHGGLPVAVQVAGHRFSDRDVLAVCAALEARRTGPMDWPLQPRAGT